MFSKTADEEVPTPPQSATAAGPAEDVTQQPAVEPPADNNNADNPDKQRWVRSFRWCSILDPQIEAFHWDVQTFEA